MIKESQIWGASEKDVPRFEKANIWSCEIVKCVFRYSVLMQHGVTKQTMMQAHANCMFAKSLITDRQYMGAKIQYPGILESGMGVKFLPLDKVQV